MAFHSRTVISSMIWKLMERISSQLVSFIVSIILARILMPEDYGIIAITFVFINLANVIIDGGLNTALIQKKNSDRIDFSTIFWVSMLLACALYVCLYFCAPLIASIYGKDRVSPSLRILGLSIFFISFNSIQRAYVSRHMLFRKLFYANSFAIFVSGIIGIVMAYGGYGIWALVGQALSSSILCCIIMWFSIRWRPTLDFSLERFKGLFDFGWKIFATNFIIAIYTDIRSIVIGKVYQPSALGYFDRGKSLPQLIMSNMLTTLNSVLLPTFSEEQNNVVRVKQMMRRSVQVGYFFVAPLLVGLFFGSRELVLALLTEKWLPAVPFIQIFCIAFFLMPIQNVNITAIQSLGYSGITLKLEIIKKILEAVILVVSFFISVYAVAWGVVLYNFICIFINLCPSKRLVGYGIGEQIKDVFPTLMVSLLMGGAVYACSFIPGNSVIVLLIQVIVGVVVYYIICRITKLESYNYMLEYLRSGLQNKTNKT